jgi:hypothetical protein
MKSAQKPKKTPKKPAQKTLKEKRAAKHFKESTGGITGTTK